MVNTAEGIHELWDQHNSSQWVSPWFMWDLTGNHHSSLHFLSNLVPCGPKQVNSTKQTQRLLNNPWLSLCFKAFYQQGFSSNFCNLTVMKSLRQRIQTGKKIPHDWFSFFSRAISCLTAIPTQTWATLFSFSARTGDAPSQNRIPPSSSSGNPSPDLCTVLMAPISEHWRFYGRDFTLAKGWNGFQAGCVSKERKSGGKCRGERTPDHNPINLCYT